jgi:LysM repeat protein
MSDTDNPILIPGNKEMSKLSPKQHFRKDKMPLILAGAGVVTLIIFFLLLFPKNQKSGTGVFTDTSEERLAQIEKRLLSLEEMNKRLTQLESRSRESENISGKVETLETSMTSRMDHIVKRLDSLQKSPEPRPADSSSRQSAKPPEKPAKAAEKIPEKVSEKVPEKVSEKVPEKVSEKVPEKVPDDTKPRPRYHELRKGENLYQISRTYRVPLEDLQRLNKITPGAVLQPGQKIILSE